MIQLRFDRISLTTVLRWKWRAKTNDNQFIVWSKLQVGQRRDHEGSCQNDSHGDDENDEIWDIFLNKNEKYMGTWDY